MKTTPDYVEEYKQEYGYIGPALCSAMVKARIPAPPSGNSTNVTNSNNTNQVNSGKTIPQAGKYIKLNVIFSY